MFPESKVARSRNLSICDIMGVFPYTHTVCIVYTYNIPALFYRINMCVYNVYISGFRAMKLKTFLAPKHIQHIYQNDGSAHKTLASSSEPMSGTKKKNQKREYEKKKRIK